MRFSEVLERAREPSITAVPSDRALLLILRTTRANAYNAQIHNPTITIVYSVSFPVWGA